MDNTQRVIAAVMMKRPEPRRSATRIFWRSGILTFQIMGTGMKDRMPMSVLRTVDLAFLGFLMYCGVGWVELGDGRGWGGKAYRTLRIVIVMRFA
jgi:hypothetical protein